MNRRAVVAVYSLLGLVILASTFVFSAEFSFLREFFFRQNSIRFSVEEPTRDHIQRIAIHNSTDQALDISFSERFTPSRTLIDIGFASVDSHIEVSFLQTLRTSASADANIYRLGDVLAALDPDYPSASLVVVADALNKDKQLELARLAKDSPDQVHRQRLLSCRSHGGGQGCGQEEALEQWERKVVDMTEKALSAWQQVTGLNCSLGKGSLYPDDEIIFSGPVPAHRTEYLTFKFDRSQTVSSKIDLHLGPGSATQVKSESDLEASSTWIAIRYHWIRTTLFGLVVLTVVLLYRYVASQATRNLGRRELVNVALASPHRRSESVWNELYGRMRPYLLSDYRHVCRTFNREPQLSGPELFQHIRNRLVMDHGSNPSPFENEQQLDARLHQHLRELALVSPAAR